MPPKSEETESLEQPVQKLTHYNTSAQHRLTILIYLYFLKRMNVGVIEGRCPLFMLRLGVAWSFQQKDKG